MHVTKVKLVLRLTNDHVSILGLKIISLLDIIVLMNEWVLKMPRHRHNVMVGRGIIPITRIGISSRVALRSEVVVEFEHPRRQKGQTLKTCLERA